MSKKPKIKPVDYYIFGHIHDPLEIDVDKNAIYINTGDWLKHYTYAVLNNKKITLEKYKKKVVKIDNLNIIFLTNLFI